MARRHKARVELNREIKQERLIEHAIPSRNSARVTGKKSNSYSHTKQCEMVFAPPLIASNGYKCISTRSHSHHLDTGHSEETKGLMKAGKHEGLRDVTGAVVACG